jgi:hypothetical protein
MTVSQRRRSSRLSISSVERSGEDAMTGFPSLLRAASVAATVSLAVSGCGLVATPGPAIECIGIPAGHCPALIREAERMSGRAGGPAISSISIRAVNPPCTDQACQGETVVVFADGTSASSGWGWQGPGAPPVPPTGPVPTRHPDGIVHPTCIALPADACAEFAVIDDLPGATPDPTVVAIEVVCTKLPCTDELGMGTTTVIHEDGTRDHSQWSYSSGGPAPTP